MDKWDERSGKLTFAEISVQWFAVEEPVYKVHLRVGGDGAVEEDLLHRHKAVVITGRLHLRSRIVSRVVALPLHRFALRLCNLPVHLFSAENLD